MTPTIAFVARAVTSESESHRLEHRRPHVPPLCCGNMCATDGCGAGTCAAPRDARRSARLPRRTPAATASCNTAQPRGPTRSSDCDRLHDLRHTTASQAVMSGENLPLVGRLLGHRRARTTAGYAHLADEHLVDAAENVGSIIASSMSTLDSSQSKASRNASLNFGN